MNHVRIVGRIKARKILEISQGVRPCKATLYQKVEILIFLGRVPTPVNWLAWNFSCGQADPRAPWSCQISHESVQLECTPVWQKCWFLACKFNTDSLLLRGILPVIKRKSEHTKLRQDFFNEQLVWSSHLVNLISIKGANNSTINKYKVRLQNYLQHLHNHLIANLESFTAFSTEKTKQNYSAPILATW